MAFVCPINNQPTKKMTYEIEQIANFEKCNAGIPISLLRAAAVSVMRDEWQHDLALGEAIHEETLDMSAAVSSVNQSLADAGCVSRVDADDVAEGLAQWVESETIKLNM
jgi:hypothetical protein